MTPQERQLVDDLFDRLAKLESAPRDPNAASAIAQGLQRAPNAVYALVQTVLLQDEALKRANSHIEELEAAINAPQQQEQSGGFLDSMRDAIFGPGQSQGRGQNQGSVPNVPPPQPQNRPVWNSGQVLQQGSPGYDQGRYGQPPSGQYGGPPYGQSYGAPPFGGGGGGSFLGTAAAAAAGVVGGSLLLNSIRGMMGGSHHGFGDAGALGDRAASPWSDQSNSSLARDAGIDDVGRSGGRADDTTNQGLFDQSSYEDDRDNMMDADADDFDTDDGGGDGSDYA